MRKKMGKVKDVRARMAALRAMGFRVAIDDLGAGYAGLTSFAQLEPEVVKFFFSSRRRHTRSLRDWRSDVCSSDLQYLLGTSIARPLIAKKQIEIAEKVL